MLIAHYEEFLPYRWQAYAAPDKSFSIEFPGKPQEEKVEVPLQDGGKAVVRMASLRPNQGTAFSCAVTDGQNISQKTPDEVLDSGLEGMLRRIQGTVLSKNRFTVEGNPGLEIQARARGNSSVDARLIVAGSHLYMIMVIGTEHSNNAKAVQRLFQSFKFG